MKVGPQSPGRSRGRPVTAAAAPSRQSPTPTWCSARCERDSVLGGTHALDAARRARRHRDASARPLGLDLRRRRRPASSGSSTRNMAVDLRLALQSRGRTRAVRARGLRRRGPAACRVPRARRRHSDVLVPLYPGLNCAMGMLQTSVRHSYLRSEIGLARRYPARRINEIFADARAAGAARRRPRRDSRREPGQDHAATRPALSASGLLPSRRLSRRSSTRTTRRVVKAGLRRRCIGGSMARARRRGCRDRDLPPAIGDRGPAPRAA